MFPIDAIKSRIQVFKPDMNAMQYTLHIIRNEGYFLLVLIIIDLMIIS